MHEDIEGGWSGQVMKQYRVTYIREPGTVTTVTVSAHSPQAARDAAQRDDPKYIATLKTPREIKP